MKSDESYFPQESRKTIRKPRQTNEQVARQVRHRQANRLSNLAYFGQITSLAVLPIALTLLFLGKINKEVVPVAFVTSFLINRQSAQRLREANAKLAELTPVKQRRTTKQKNKSIQVSQTKPPKSQ
jgi:hypothetical protein